jgi:hypothetical protein
MSGLNKESIETMVHQIVTGDKSGARDTFHSIIADKVSAELETLKVDSANQFFNGVKEETEHLEEATRKDFRSAAEEIKKISDQGERQRAANLHASIFAKSNPRFNHSMFHAACGTKAQ